VIKHCFVAVPSLVSQSCDTAMSALVITQVIHSM